MVERNDWDKDFPIRVKRKSGKTTYFAIGRDALRTRSWLHDRLVKLAKEKRKWNKENCEEH